MAFHLVELLGWSDATLADLEQRRGWTTSAIERLELGYNAGRVTIPVRDETGDELGVLRYDPTGTRSPKMLAEAGVPRELFPPPEVIANDEPRASTVFLVEGEPDAARLWSLGLVAVGIPGSQSWRDEWAARFTGRGWRIAVCFDCDAPGRQGAHRAAEALTENGAAVHLVDLDPTRDDGYDLTDWAAGATTAALREQAAEALLTIVDATPTYSPAPSAAEADADERPWVSVPWSAFRDTAPPAQRWLVEGLLPAGALAFVAGPPKRGKTWVGLGLSICLALGHPFAAHTVPEPRDVLYVALEGSQTGLRTRIGALTRGFGADPDSDDLAFLHLLYRPRPFDLSQLASANWLLEEALDTDAGLIVIDVLRAAARFRENDAEDFARIRDHLGPLLEAERTVMLLHHFGKLSDTQKERSPGERMAGTGAMYGALDVGYLITRSENHARNVGVTVEARDFAAPDALDLVILGEGSGQHGGFSYTDTATLMVDVAAGHRSIILEALEYLRDRPDGAAAEEIARALEIRPEAFRHEVEEDTERLEKLGEPPAIVRWDYERWGRFSPDRKINYRPYLTYEFCSSRVGTGRTGRGESDPDQAVTLLLPSPLPLQGSGGTGRSGDDGPSASEPGTGRT